MIHVRELPPLRLHLEIITPDGRTLRWGDDEPNPANIPAGLTFSSTMPGGYEQLDVSLARKAGVDYSDLARLSTLRVRGPGGDIAWEGRLERTPRVSGDQMAISPSAVGWQAHLDDDKSAREIYVDRDLGSWQDPPLARNAAIAGAFNLGNIAQTSSGGLVWDITAEPISASLAELYYTAPAGRTLGSIAYQGARTGAFLNFENATIFSTASADFPSVIGSSVLTVDDTVRTASFTAARYLVLRAFIAGSITPGAPWQQRYSKMAVYGTHGLTQRTISGDTPGFYASDIVTDAVGRWAPLLTFDGTVQASSFVIPHLTFPDPTTAGEIIRQATSFGLQDWAVWDNRTFYWAERGTYGRKWRARIAPAQLSETGPQLDRLWESVIVSYTDVDGTTRTVGPVGSGADTEDAVLHDTDPENPANQRGIVRRDLLSMGTSTAAGATEVGRRFLEEQKLLDTSGQAQLVGHVTDDHGMLHPYWRVRAGDTISFVDASDTSERRIVRASHDHGSRTCTVDLDAPPEGLDSLLARLGVVLVPLGLS